MTNPEQSNSLITEAIVERASEAMWLNDWEQMGTRQREVVRGQVRRSLEAVEGDILEDINRRIRGAYDVGREDVGTRS